METKLKRPASMAELVFYTKRNMPECKAEVWVFRDKCPKCHKAIPKKPKMRAKFYICPECKAEIPKEEYESGLKASVAYECHKCSHKGEKQQPFKRENAAIIDPVKNKKVYVPALKVTCDKCGALIKVTKKMK